MHIDNSKVFHEGTYADETVYVPASTTYKTGTVLGRDESGNLTAFTSAVTGSEPIYILAQNLVNSETSAVSYDLVRVFDGGVVDKNKLIFVNEDDAEDNDVLDSLKTSGFRLINVEDVIDETNFAGDDDEDETDDDETEEETTDEESTDEETEE